MADINSIRLSNRQVNYELLAILAIIAFSMAVYLPTLNGYWISDDFPFVVKYDWAQVFNFFNLARGGFFYRPLSWLIYAANWELWGNNPTMWHATNLVLNTAVCLMLWLLVRSLSHSFVATLVAFFYVVHPAHPAAVAWVSALPDLWSTLLYLACVAAFIRYRQQGRGLFYAISLLLLILAIISKETAVTAPAMIVLIDLLYFTPQRRTANGAVADTDWRRLISRKLWLYAPFVLISGGYLLLRLWLDAQHLLFFGYAPVLKAVPDVFANTAGYVAMVMGMPSVYGFAPQLAVALLLLILVAYVVTLRREPLGWLGFGWAAVNLVPVLNIAVHDENARYAYLSSIGICMVLGVMATKVWQAVGGKAVRYAVAAAVVAVMSYGLWLTNELNGEWVGAGDLAHRVISEIKAAEPSVPPVSEFFIANQPTTYKRALVLFVGLPEAIKMAYGDGSLRVFARNINPTRFNTAIQQSIGNHRYYFAYVDGRMVEFPDAASLLRQVGP